MKIIHFLATMAISSLLGACNGGQYIVNRDPVDYVNPYIGNISHLLVPTFPTIQLPNSMLRVYPERADYTTELLNGLPIIVTNHRERSAFNLSPYQGTNLNPIIAYNYGAGQRKRMLKTIKLSMLVAFCLTFIGFLCFEGIPQILLGMFNASDEMLTIGVPALRIIGIHYLIAWFCIVSGTVFQALGKAFFSMIVSIMRQLFVLIPAAYILAKLGGLHVVWWSFPIAESMSLAVSTIFLLRIYKKIIKPLPDKE